MFARAAGILPQRSQLSDSTAGLERIVRHASANGLRRAIKSRIGRLNPGKGAISAPIADHGQENSLLRFAIGYSSATGLVTPSDSGVDADSYRIGSPQCG